MKTSCFFVCNFKAFKKLIILSLYCHRDLLRASSMSGEITILCPAFKCNEELNMRDIAHVLSNQSSHICKHDILLIMSLMRYRMDNALLARNMKYCSTPQCNRQFCSKIATTDKLGSGQHCVKVGLCKCGVSRCEMCEQPAHFGISCQDAKRMSQETQSGNLDSEYRR